jgi:uncharacterized protein involved in exopolysaccharide biosynthesis
MTKSFLNSLFRDARRIVSVAVAVFLLALLVSQLKPQSYTATATLLVLGSDDYASRPATLTPQAAQPAVMMNREAILSAEMAILNSPAVVRRALEEVGVDRLYPDLAGSSASKGWRDGWGAWLATSAMDAATERFGSKLRLVADRSGGTLEVRFSDSDPQQAAKALNSLLAQYQQRRQVIYRSAESSAMEGAVDSARDKLEALSRHLSEFEAVNGISNFDIQMDLLLRRQAEHAGLLQRAQIEAAEAERRLASLRKQLDDTPSEVVHYQDTESDRRVQAMRDQLADLRRQEAELLQTYTDASERVATVRRQIRAIEQEIDRGSAVTRPTGVRRGINEVRTAIELELVRAISQSNAGVQRRQDLAGQVQVILSTIQALQDKHENLDDLKRRKSLAEQDFVLATRALQERRSMEEFDAKRTANVRTIAAADVPTHPDRTRLLILLGGLLLSIVAAASVALLSHHLRSTYLDEHELERDTRYPLLGALGKLTQPPPVLTLGG